MRYNGVFDAVRRMFHEEGILTFYRGIGPSLSLCSNHALQLMFYERLRRWSLINFHDRESPNPTVRETLLMGASAKTLSATITYPLYIVRSRLYQRAERDPSGLKKKKYKFSGFRDVLQRTFRHEGFLGFYKGLTPHLMKTAPSSALTFTFYEYLITFAGAKW